MENIKRGNENFENTIISTGVVTEPSVKATKLSLTSAIYMLLNTPMGVTCVWER